MPQKRKVYVESPYAGDVENNMRYLKDCLADCLRRHENPYASHLFFTQFLDDTDLYQRKLGITLGDEWRLLCDCTVFYVDLGWSRGMLAGKDFCLDRELSYRIRSIR